MELDDLLALHVPGATHALDDPLTLGGAHGDVVERDIGISSTTEGQAVVVDVLHTGRSSLLLDRRTRVTVEVHDRQHLDTIGDHLIGDRGHVVDVTLGILDVALDARLGALRLDQRTVELFPTSR